MAKQTYYFRDTTGRVFASSSLEWYKSEERLTKAEGEKLYREQYRADLLERIKPGDTIYSLVCRVSRSGMMRHILLFHVHNGELNDITYAASILTRTKQADNGGLKMAGCGYDVGHSAVYNLSSALWPNGTPDPHGKRNGEPDSTGGYALKQSAI